MSLTKQNFIEMLTQNLEDGPNKDLLLKYAQEMVPGAWSQKQLKALNNRNVLRANWAYAALHPDTKDEKHTIDQVVDWLLEVGGVDYARELENRLQRIQAILETYGAIDVDEAYTLTGAQLLMLRSNAYCVPIIRN